MMTIVSIVLAIGVVKWILAYHRANAVAWTLALAALSAAVTFATGAPPAVYTAFWIVTGVFGALSIVKPLRRALVTGPIFSLYKKIMPQVSQTEQEALDAGSIWWDADLFTGAPTGRSCSSTRTPSSPPRSRRSSTTPSKSSARC